MERPVIIENRGARVRWRLQALAARQHAGRIRLTRPLLTLFDRDGNPIPVRGDQATFDPLKRTARFRGHVTIDYRSWHLQSTQARFDGARRTVRIPGAFSAVGEGRRMQGADLIIDERRQRLTVRRHVRIEGL